ncbi:protein Mis18-alpha [Fundulus diaphanus]
MATKGNSAELRRKCKDLTFDSSTINSTVVEKSLFGRADKDEEEVDDDAPVIFFCGKCKLPVGDSMSWDGVEHEQNQIRLKRVTNNVLVGKETRLLELSKKSACLVVDLICRSCRLVLGMIYQSTPRSQDNKMFTFCFNVASIDSYVLGSGRQMPAAEGPKEQPVTLEYTHNVEQQLAQMKMLVVSMAQRLEEIEAGLMEGCSGLDGDGR